MIERFINRPPSQASLKCLLGLFVLNKVHIITLYMDHYEHDMFTSLLVLIAQQEGDRKLC